MVKVDSRVLNAYRELPLNTPVINAMRIVARRHAKKNKLDKRSLQLIEEAKFLGELEAAFQFARMRKDAIKAAKDLYYDDKCLDEIQRATNPAALERAMINGRHRYFAYT